MNRSVFELESRNQNIDGQTNRQTDVGHINLIGRLVTGKMRSTVRTATTRAETVMVMGRQTLKEDQLLPKPEGYSADSCPTYL